jgi:HipA-like protein
MSALVVYLHGSRVGVLEADERGFLRFTYASGWLARGDAVPLSRGLPLSSGASA